MNKHFSTYLTKWEALISETDVINLCKPLFDKFNVEFFNFGRMYDDGTFYIMSTNQILMEYLFQNQHPIFCPVPEKLVRKKFYYLLPTTGSYQQVVHEVSQYFNLANGFDIFECHAGYIDVCCFASSTNEHEMPNIYFNNIDFLEKFILYFKSQIADVLTRLPERNLILPAGMRLNFNSTINKTNKNEIFFYNGQSIFLSKREVDVLRFLVRGKTTKEIASKLLISPRTVENYLVKIKIKTNSYSKSDLIEKMIDQFNLSPMPVNIEYFPVDS